MKTSTTTTEHHLNFFANVVHLYVLHHACLRPTFGLLVIEELARFGYKVSPGTIYPLLEALERKHLVRSRVVRDGSIRRIYRATAAGRQALKAARAPVRTLVDEVCKRRRRPGSKTARGRAR